ncbi:MAG: type II secretion system protein GspD [Verrucomicrobia bacterium]|jgi:general secretion pathway protein D|nr:type II secretion system protein GspD [Verrucomicrobiota bacterium]MBT7066296.1 type II secretion system protein GspD [Verrucomicrobiota bacterium]MBT7699662.1 type II secretion system protein GspD [Verrucomicrobiota bacterium]
MGARKMAGSQYSVSKFSLPLVLVVCLLFGLVTSTAPAAPKPLTDYDLPGLQNKVSLTSLDPWDVVQLIEFLAHRGGLNNMVIGPGVSGLTTKLKFDDVSVGDALEVVLSVNNLAYEIRGGIVTIMTDAEYQAKTGTSFYNNKQVKMVELKYADPARVATMLEPVKSTIGTVVADPVTGVLILIDTADKIAEMETIIARADLSTVSRVLPTETQTFELMYADVATLQPEITAILTPDVGQLRVDDRTKSLIVTALPHKMEQIKHLVKVFDQRPRQVFIEAKIVQVSLSDDYRLGVNWDHVFQGIDPRFALSSASTPGSLSSVGEAVSPAASLTYNTILGNADLTVVLQALKQVGETKILSNPHVAVLDGEEATIKVVTDQPYAEAQLESGTTNVVGETVTFIEVGVSLAVTPRISGDGMISTTIRPEVSSVIGSYQAFRTVPIVRRSYAETTVMVKDRETVIIAGMIENSKQQTQSRVPFLGRIPLLGVLFRTTSDEVASKELIAFLTPRIVSGEEPHPLSGTQTKTLKPMRR